jgi:hypothetical protein
MVNILLFIKKFYKNYSNYLKFTQYDTLFHNIVNVSFFVFKSHLGILKATGQIWLTGKFVYSMLLISVNKLGLFLKFPQSILNTSGVNKFRLAFATFGN